MSEESAGDFLQRLGIDGDLWAREFCAKFPIDLDVARAWFCNAIMAGYDRRGREVERLRKIIEDAPHSSRCSSDLRNIQRCDCWKREVLE